MRKHRRVLFIAAHPDDETLGCGGTILRYRSLGDKVYWLIITNMSQNAGFTDKMIESRQKEINKVAKVYKFNGIFKLDFPTAKLDRIPLTRIIEEVANAINIIKPEIVFLPHSGDVHTDHQITHKAAIASTKSFRAAGIKKVLAYETVSETEFAIPDKKNAFLPNMFVDITPYMDKKIKIMKLYKNEIKPFPFPRSEKNLKALATFRGVVIGVHYAEAFMVIRESFV